MSIYGIGVDQVDLKRVKRLLNKSEDKFLKRCFTEQEIKYAKRFSDPSKRLGARFAAKEALSKSFGTGIRDNLSFKDIEILNDKMGKPFFYKSKKIDKIIKKKFKIKKYDLFLSLSDEKDHSIAFTILVKR